MKKDFKKGFSDGIPIGLGYFSVSFGFGILAMSSRISAFFAWLISATNLTSAGQVAGVEIIISIHITKNKYFHLEILICYDNFNIYKAKIDIQIVSYVIVLNIHICYTVGQRLKKGQHYAKGI